MQPLSKFTALPTELVPYKLLHNHFEYQVFIALHSVYLRILSSNLRVSIGCCLDVYCLSLCCGHVRESLDVLCCQSIDAGFRDLQAG